MNNKHKWIHFKFSHDFFPEYDGNSYELIVYADKEDHFYFFGNAILWCLGYSEPHISMLHKVKENQQLNVPLGSGVFLTEQVVQRLITSRFNDTKNPNYKAFGDWFENYLKVCKEINPPKDCPRN